MTATATTNLTALLESVSAVAERHISMTRALWWRENGHMGQVPAKVAALRALAEEGHGGVACEVGFNAGHSAAVLLDSSKIRLLHEFDIMVQPYSNASCEHFERRYGGRFLMHRGNSRHTVKALARRVASGAEAGCGLWFLDGAHSRLFARDMENAMAAAAPDAVFMVDDVSPRFPKVQHVWRSFVNMGRLRQRACVNITLPPPAGLKGWCVGTKAPARTKKPAAAASRRAPPLGQGQGRRLLGGKGKSGGGFSGLSNSRRRGVEGPEQLCGAALRSAAERSAASSAVFDPAQWPYRPAGGKLAAWLRAAPAVPQRLHQTWRSCQLPPRQAAWRASCERHPPAWEAWLWTDEDNRALVRDNFPSLFRTYDGYDKNINRVDAIRFMYLFRYGGVYMDTDYACLRPWGQVAGLLPPGHAVFGLALSPDTETNPQSSGVPRRALRNLRWGNAWMAAPPGHPFLDFLLSELNAAAKHANVIRAAGSRFLTSNLERWIAMHGDRPASAAVTIQPWGVLYNTKAIPGAPPHPCGNGTAAELDACAHHGRRAGDKKAA